MNMISLAVQCDAIEIVDWNKLAYRRVAHRGAAAAFLPSSFFTLLNFTLCGARRTQLQMFCQRMQIQRSSIRTQGRRRFISQFHRGAFYCPPHRATAISFYLVRIITTTI